MANDNGRRQIWRRVKNPLSYGKVVQPNKASSPNGVDVEGTRKSCFAIQDQDLVRSLSRCIVARPKGEFDASWLHRKFREEGFRDRIVRKCPNGVLLIEFREKMEWEMLCRSEFYELSRWLDDIKIWDDAFEPSDRLAWVAINGLPLRFWSFFTFENLANIWGTLIKVCEKSDLKLDLSTAYIQIRCNQSMRIDETIEVKHNGVSFPVRVRELNACKEILDYDSMIIPPELVAEVSEKKSGGDSNRELEGYQLERVSESQFPFSESGIVKKNGAIEKASINDRNYTDSDSLASSKAADCVFSAWAVNQANIVLFGPSDFNLDLEDEFSVEISTPGVNPDNLPGLVFVDPIPIRIEGEEPIPLIGNDLVHIDLENMGLIPSNLEASFSSLSKSKLKLKAKKKNLIPKNPIPLSGPQSKKITGIVSRSTKSASSLSSANSGQVSKVLPAVGDPSKKRSRIIDPKAQWEFSKAFECVASVSDEEMIARIKQLDRNI